MKEATQSCLDVNHKWFTSQSVEKVRLELGFF